METGTGPRAKTSRTIASFLALACVVVVALEGHRSLAGVTRPFDIDQFREVASAQAFVDGHFLRDPFYAGETIWYNPLLSATVAVLSRLTRSNVALTFVQAGPFLNALAPLMLFAMTAVLFGEWPALIALVSLLFGSFHDDPAWATPTYSPWLFPATFAPALFYGGIILCALAIQKNQRRWWIFTGAALGLTFLAHTAPALILGTCCTMSVWWARRGPSSGVRSQWLERVTAWFLVLATAAMVSAPLIWSIAVHYRMHIVNAAPNNWVWSALEVSRARELLSSSWMTYGSIPSLVGLVIVARRARLDVPARLVACWAFVACVLFAYGLLLQTPSFNRLPPLVPLHHFYSYIRAVGHVLTGTAVWTALSGTVSVAWRLAHASPGKWARMTVGATLAFILGSFVVTNLSDYQRRPGFHHEHSTAVDRTWEERDTNVTERLRSQTPTDAVVLSSLDDSMFMVAPAGRRVVSVPPEMSNPYVDVAGREQDRRNMLAAVRYGEISVFRQTFIRYGVTHVLLKEQVPGDAVRRMSDVILLSWQGDVSLYEIRPAKER